MALASSPASSHLRRDTECLEYLAQTDLAPMSVASNYYRWILEYSRPYLGRHVLEHGAGIGTFSTFLLEETIDKLVAVEPARNLIPTLSERLAGGREKVELVPSTLEEYAAGRDGHAIDTVISINVLEHIPDDVETLRTMWEILPEGGRIILFVPALSWLYGSLDRAVGHERRYGRRELHAKVCQAGFQIVATRFMNLPGVVSWLITGRVLRRPSLDIRAVKLYDRCIIPMVATLERFYPPPIGQNLLLVARKCRE